jgi:ABC-2 type transport system ATP-binding protein
VQDICDRIAILHQGELKELGRVDALLEVRQQTEIRASGLSQEAQDEVRQVIERHGGKLVSMGYPTATLEELFLRIIRESEAHPGRRVRKTGPTAGAAGPPADQAVILADADGSPSDAARDAEGSG